MLDVFTWAAFGGLTFAIAGITVYARKHGIN